jgi:hypothetical protein
MSSRLWFAIHMPAFAAGLSAYPPVETTVNDQRTRR